MLLTRMLIACLSVWLVDQCLAKFGVGGSAAKLVQIIVIILALVFIFFGWAVDLGVK